MYFVITVALFVQCGGRKKYSRTLNQSCYISILTDRSAQHYVVSEVLFIFIGIYYVGLGGSNTPVLKMLQGLLIPGLFVPGRERKSSCFVTLWVLYNHP